MPVRKWTYERDEGLCSRGSASNREVHHIVFRSQMGLSNLTLLPAEIVIYVNMDQMRNREILKEPKNANGRTKNDVKICHQVRILRYASNNAKPIICLYVVDADDDGVCKCT